MSRPQKPYTAQIRPSVKTDTIVVLEALQKDGELGKTIESLLEESPTYKQKEKQLKEFKEK